MISLLCKWTWICNDDGIANRRSYAELRLAFKWTCPVQFWWPLNVIEDWVTYHLKSVRQFQREIELYGDSEWQSEIQQVAKMTNKEAFTMNRTMVYWSSKAKQRGLSTPKMAKQMDSWWNNKFNSVKEIWRTWDTSFKSVWKERKCLDWEQSSIGLTEVLYERCT